MKVLVTGGAGFIGSYVVKEFLAQGHEVVIADRFTYAGKGRRLEPILRDVQLLIGDLATGDLAERCAAEQPEWVVHMAAETHVDRAISHPESFMWSNVVGTTRLLQALVQYGACPTHIIVYSTDEVYGPTPPGVVFDEAAPFKPSNAYSASKVGVEGVAHSFWVTHQLPIVVVRPCNTYGPGQHPEKVIPKFVRQMLQAEWVTLYNDGQGSRDWLYATDHARGILTLCQQGIPGESYNLAAGDEHTDYEIADSIRAVLATDSPVAHLFAEGVEHIQHYTYVPGRPGHDRRYAMDGRKLRALGWTPVVPFAEGLRETVHWAIAHEDWWQHDRVQVSI